MPKEMVRATTQIVHVPTANAATIVPVADKPTYDQKKKPSIGRFFYFKKCLKSIVL
jgi:hypothetical protein